MLDMGTKVQFESYFSRYYPMRNLNEDMSSNQSRYYEDEAFNRQLFVDIKPSPMSGYSEYDKEMLKRTMLEHEAIFRKQVYELHRLYRVQKDMMDEFKREHLYKVCGPIDTSKRSIFTSQMTPEASERELHSSYAPSVRNHYKAVDVTDTDDKRAPINFLKEVSIQCLPNSTDNGGYFKKDRSLDPNPRNPRRTFDLHLPADVYIESDDSEIAQKQNPEPFVSSAYKLDINTNVAPESEVSLTLATVNFDSCSENNQRSNMQQKNDQPFGGLADLNEPCNDLYDEGTSASGSCIPKNLFHCEDSHINSTLTSNSFSLQRDVLTGRSKEEGTFLSNFSVDKGDHRRQWSLLHESEKYPMSSESIQLRLKKVHEGHLPDKSKSDEPFRYKVTELDEMSGRNPNAFKLSYSRHSDEEAINKPSYVSSLMNPTSSLTGSSWKSSGKMNHMSIAIQARPSFIDRSNNQCSAVQSQNNGYGKMQCNGNPQPHCANSGESYYANAFTHGFPLDSKTSSSKHLLPITIDKPNLNGVNSTYENFSNEPQKCLKTLQCIDIKCAKELDLNSEMTKKNSFGLTAREELNGKHDGLNALHWLNKPTTNKFAHDKSHDPQKDRDFTKGYPQQISSSGKVDNGTVIGEHDKGISVCTLQNPISSFKLQECRNQRNGVSYNPNNKEIISFSLLEKLQQSFSHTTNSVQYQEQLLADKQKCTRKGKSVKSNNITIRKDINLNSFVIAPEDSYFPGNTVKDKELLSTASFACNTGNISCKIDLEAPVEVEHNTTAAELVKMNHLEEPGDKDRFYLHDTLRVAANTIVSLSMDAQNLVSIVSAALDPASCDSLRWFAEVVTSNSDITADSRGKGSGGIHVSDDDGSDSFESLTLKLEELKEDEYWCRPYKHEIPQDDDDKFTLSPLFTKSRRGQARKRRQRKDFQRDILPTIASLSRQEVAEDLYSLGGLTKTSSKARNTGSGRRGTGRNSQTRGRKPRSLAVTTAEVHESPPPMQSTPDLETDGTGIKGWGRTTRRCRRQRTQVIPAPGLQE